MESTPPALDEFQRGFPGLSGRTRRFARFVLNSRIEIAAAGLVAVFALGIWLGSRMSGPAAAPVESQVAANPAPAPAAEAVPMAAEPGLVREARASLIPSVAGSTSEAPAVTGKPAPETRTAADTPATDAPAVKDKPAPEARIATGKPTTEAPAVATTHVPPVPAAKTAAKVETVPEAKTRPVSVAEVKPVKREPRATTSKPVVRPTVFRSKAAASSRYHGTLAVRSEPLGALVTVDGEIVGPTPLLLKSVPAGSRVIRIESDGYERWSSAARVVANRETSIVANLQRGSSQ